MRLAETCDAKLVSVQSDGIRYLHQWGISMVEGKPSKLRTELKKKNTALAVEADAIIQQVTPLLWRTIASFSSGTSHTPDHTAAVERIASNLVSKELLRELNADEIQALILACHFHDLGMAGTEHQNRSEESRDQIRRDHAIKVGERILSSWRQFGLRDHTQADILAEVCRGHRPKKNEDGVATWSDLRAVLNVAPDRSVRIRVVAALVYAADELHIGADRAPLREQEAAQIENEESLRHWKRHQAISGPSLINGRLRFDCRSSTLIHEADLRSKVLRKAFSAVRDGQSELIANGLKGTMPQIGVAWNRSGIWELLILEILSKNGAISAIDLRSKVADRFCAALQTNDLLTGHCISETKPADEANELERTIGDWQTNNYIVLNATTGTALLQLDFGKDAISRFFSITSEADETDILFEGRFSGHHQFNLLKSPFGSDFADKVLAPIVRDRFGVFLDRGATEEAVRDLIRTSPSAARLILDFAPSASIIAQRHLLRSVVLTGATLDTLRAPELMLDAKFRTAITRLSGQHATGQSVFLELVEELALVTGYEDQHVFDALIPSEPAQQAMADKCRPQGAPELDTVSAPVTLSVTQSYPTSATSRASFGHLLAAASRAGQPIEFVTVESIFSIKDRREGLDRDSTDDPVSVTIGPSETTFKPLIGLRCTVKTGEGVIRLEGVALTDKESRLLPIIISLSKRDINGPSPQVGIGIYPPACTAQNVLAIRHLIRDAGSGEAFVSLVWGEHEASIKAAALSQAIDIWMPPWLDGQALEFLAGCAATTPIPWVFNESGYGWLSDAHSPDKVERIQRAQASSITEKLLLSTLTIRFATHDNKDISENFVRFFPGDIFGPPQIKTHPTMSQAAFDRHWNDPNEGSIVGTYFSDDIAGILQKLKVWSSSDDADFPFTLSSGPPDTPVCKTCMEIVRHRAIDRLWYTERPITIRLRPVRREEYWMLEESYFRSKGDLPRAAFLHDRISANKETKSPE